MNDQAQNQGNQATGTPQTTGDTPKVPPSPLNDITYQAEDISSPVTESFSQPASTPVSSPSSMQEISGEIPASPFQTQEDSMNPAPIEPTVSETQQPPIQQVPPVAVPAPPQGPITATPRSGSFSKFKVFVVIAIIAIVAIYSFVTFLYFQNKKLKSEVTEVPPVTTGDVANGEQNLLPTVPPPVVATAENVKILNGNVVLQTSPDAESKVLVSKEDFSSTGITGFARVAVSEDGKMLCFESWPPAPEPALYIANADGSDVQEVSPNRQNCLWALDTTKVYYSDYLSKTSAKNIYAYDIATGVETSLTENSQPTATNRAYDIVGLSSDGAKLICTYIEGKTKTGQCEIDLATSEVVLLEE